MDLKLKKLITNFTTYERYLFLFTFSAYTSMHAYFIGPKKQF